MRRIRLTVVLLLAAGLLPACGGSDEGGGPSTMPASGPAASPVTLTGGSTNLDLDPQTVGVLDDNDVTIVPIPPARDSSLGVRLPIVGGTLRPDTFDGTIRHAGGLAITDGVRRISVRSLVLDTRTGQLSGDAGAGRIPLLNLDLSSGRRLDAGGTVALGNIPATLTSAAAHAIDDGLHTSVLTPSLPMAFATVQASG